MFKHRTNMNFLNRSLVFSFGISSSSLIEGGISQSKISHMACHSSLPVQMIRCSLSSVYSFHLLNNSKNFVLDGTYNGHCPEKPD
jgi:hypothetical protein